LTPRWVLLPALGLSLGLHAALLALPARTARVPAPEAPPVEVEVRQVPAPEPSPPPGPGQAPAPSIALRPRLRPPAAPASAPAAPDPVAVTTSEAGTVAVPAGEPELAGVAPSSGSGSAAPGGGQGPGGTGIDPSLLAGYVRRLNQAVQRHFEYPQRAERQGLQGRVVVRVVLDGGGLLRGASLAASSGHDVLDRAALAMMGEVDFPAPPAELHWGTRPVDIPVDYAIAP
jgi:protein TonB